MIDVSKIQSFSLKVMRYRLAFATTLVSLLAVVWFGSKHFERFDGSFIFITPTTVYDPIGNIENLYDRLSRNCSGVSEVQRQTKDWTAIKYALSHMEKSFTTEASPLKVMRQDNWFIVETEFSSLEPAIFLLSQNGEKFQVHSQGTWSGAAAPWTPGPVIRKYIQHQVPDAPRSLINCFEPTLTHFKS